MTLESVALDIAADDTVTLHARIYGQDATIAVGQGRWSNGTFAVAPDKAEDAAASGAWTADDTYTVELARRHEPFVATFHLKFAGDQVQVDREMNVGFNGNKPLTLTGKAQ
ncbi:MAG: hypothetical protein WDM96_18560 [Lacunisphaera sp.]